MVDYVPRKDHLLGGWLHGLSRFCADHGEELRLPDGLSQALAASSEGWRTAYEDHLEAHSRARGAAAAKDDQRKAAVDLARQAVRILQASPAMTNVLREEAGITIPESAPAVYRPELIQRQVPPLVLLDWSHRSKMIIHYGPNPANERENPMPPGMVGVRIWMSDKGREAAESEWTFLAGHRRSPYIHKLNNNRSITIAYRVQYIDRAQNAGSFSIPVEGTVSG